MSALILHYTGMRSLEEARDRLCDPISEVSAHYLIDEEGRIECLVEENRTAWHAGVSAWRDMVGLNKHSIGIELVNPGHEWGYCPFSESQLNACCQLVRKILARHPIPSLNILGHSDVAPGRKQDPGELFPWRAWAAKGLGLWPERIPCDLDEQKARDRLLKIGYNFDLPATTSADVLSAFQRRYRPSLVDGVLDQETMELIQGLAQMMERS